MPSPSANYTGDAMIERLGDRARWTGAEPLSIPATLSFAIGFLGIVWFSFSQNEHCLMTGLDGNWYRVMFANEMVARAPFTQTGVDALSGNFDAWYPLRPEYLLPHALALPFGLPSFDKTYIYVLYSGLLALAIYLVARTLRTGRAVALAAGLLTCILAAPGFVDHLAQLFPLWQQNPYWFQNTALGCFIVTAFWALDSDGRLKTVLLIATPTLCLALAVISSPHFLFMLPATCAYGAASLLSARRVVADNLPRLTAVLLMIAVPAALGIFTYYYAAIGYTSYRFFPQEIQHPLGGWMALSTAFWTSPFGAWMVSLGLAGALWSSIVGVGRLRVFAITHLLVTCLFFAFGYWFSFLALSYRGSWPVYFETSVWPYALMFSVIAIAAALRLVLSGVGEVLRLPRRFASALPGGAVPAGAIAGLGSLAAVLDWLRERSAAVMLLGIMLAVASYNIGVVTAPQRRDGCIDGGFAPIRPTPITEQLQRRIALTPGTPFRGLAATIDGVKPGRPGDWIEFHDHDRTLWQDTGNDDRTVGLWRFNIPTLFQYHTFITPPYYLMLTEFLSRPEDHQIRSVVTMSRIDAPMMQLWGVRYLVTDLATGAGKTIAQEPTEDIGTLRLVELPHPNLGDYSPTEVREAKDFRSGLSIMHAPGFDGRRQVVAEAAPAGPFVPATGAELVYERDGFHIEAHSTGQSVLVLPVQYSHCWTAAGASEPELFRADLMQLGLRFSGALDAELVFRFGPFLASGCRIEDLRDMSRLHIEQARSADWRIAAQP
jgi:hypothetical protein